MNQQQAEPASPQRALGRELRKARQRAGCTQAALARQIGSTQGTVSYAERGHLGIARPFWAAADDTLATGGTLASAYDQIIRSRTMVISPDCDLMTALRDGEIQFLTVAEMAGLARLSKMTIYRLVHTGELQARRFGRVFRIPVDSASQYLSQHTPATSRSAPGTLPGGTTTTTPLP